MFQLFSELRGEKFNEQGAIISRRCLDICAAIGDAQKLSLKELQQRLVSQGKEWAIGNAGYMSIWTLCARLRAAGLLVGNRRAGVSLAPMDVAVDLVAAAMTDLIENCIPDQGELGVLRREMMNMVLGYAVKTRARIYMRNVVSGQAERGA